MDARTGHKSLSSNTALSDTTIAESYFGAHACSEIPYIATVQQCMKCSIYKY
jgi:hypothetical protein